MRINNPIPTPERAAQLKKAGEAAMCHGKKAADMTRDELLMFIGLMCETQIFQGRQLAQAAKNIQELIDKADPKPRYDPRFQPWLAQEEEP